MFWLENPSLLFNNENYVHFVPTEQMTLIEKMNAITRFCVYGIFVGTILNFNDNIIHLLFTIIIGIIVIYKLNQNNVNLFNNSTLSSNNINKLSDDLSKLIIKNPTLFRIQIGTLFCGKFSAACQLPPQLICKWILSLGPEIFKLFCFRSLAPSVFVFFFSYQNAVSQSCFVYCELQHLLNQRGLNFEPQFCC